jgi:type I restriction enzyme S subunit
MSEWKESIVGEYADVLSGYAFKSAEFSTVGIPIVKIRNVASGQLNMADCQSYAGTLNDKLRRYFIGRNDILIAMTGSHVT